MRPLILLETLLDCDMERWAWSEFLPHMKRKIKCLCIIKFKKIFVFLEGNQKGEKEGRKAQDQSDYMSLEFP